MRQHIINSLLTLVDTVFQHRLVSAVNSLMHIFADPHSSSFIFYLFIFCHKPYRKLGCHHVHPCLWAPDDSSRLGKIGLCPLASDLLAIDLQLTVYLLSRRWSANLEGLEMALSFSRWQLLFSTGFWHMCYHPSMSRRHLLIWLLEMLLLKTRDCSSSVLWASCWFC